MLFMASEPEKKEEEETGEERNPRNGAAVTVQGETVIAADETCEPEEATNDCATARAKVTQEAISGRSKLLRR